MPASKSRRFPWVFVSVLVHGLVLGVMFFFLAPDRDLDAAKKKPKTTVSRDRLKEVHEKLRKASVARLREKVQTLEQIEKELAKVEEKKEERYQKDTEPLRAAAIEEAKGAMEKTLAFQKDAVGKLAAASAADEEAARQFAAMVESLPQVRATESNAP